MKRKVFLLPALIAATLLCFSSCSDDDNNPPVDNGNSGNGDNDGVVKEKLLTKIDYSANGNDGDIYLFEYDSQNRLTKYTEREEVDGAYVDYEVSTIVYDTEGRPSRIDVAHIDQENDNYDYTTFTYSGDTIFAIGKTYIGTENSYTWRDHTDTLLLNSNNQIKELLRGATTPTREPYYEKMKYTYDSNLNLLKEETPYYTYTYEYDNSKSILRNQKTPSWFFLYNTDFNIDMHIGKNNGIKELCEYKNGDDDETDEWEYILDGDGYPIGGKDKDGNVRENIFSYKDL